MENVSDALIMAGQVLIFIIALTVCISSFSTLRAGIDSTISQTETIKFAKDSEGYINFIQSRDSGATRIVGAETVVSSLYRSIKEDYTLYLILSEPYGNLISKFDSYNAKKDRNFYDILYEKDITNGKLIIKFTIGQDANSIPDTILKIGLYDDIKGKNFEEHIGEYQEEFDGVSSENKKVNRIITYIEKE